MYPTPDNPDLTARMRAAHERARAVLGVRPAPDAAETWGWHGRTLSQQVIAPDGAAWLRLASGPTSQTDTTFWDGSIHAERAIPTSVPRPRLHRNHDWSDRQWKYRAELYDHITSAPITTSLTLTNAPSLPATWWTALRTALDAITNTPTHRFTTEQYYLDHAMPHFLGTPINTTPPSWSTAHGDLHFANLCAPDLLILDWEGWGLAPTGYDAAVLHSYSLLVPSTAAHIRAEFAHLLDTPAGRFAELVAITELLESTARGDNLDLAQPLLNRAAQLLRRAVPPVRQLSNEPLQHNAELDVTDWETVAAGFRNDDSRLRSTRGRARAE